MSLNTTLGIALSSLQASQSGLNTVSHNMANVNTAGYSRQQILQESVTVNSFGNGVKINEVLQVKDKFVRNNLVSQTSSLGYAAKTSEFMQNIEVIFGTPGSSSSVEKIINDYYAELNKLSASPESSAQRLNVVKSAELMVDAINDVRNQLTTTQRQADEDIDSEIAIVNRALIEIKDLNDKIAQINATGVSGQNANDLVDQRQQLINTVAERIDLQINYDQYDRASLQAKDGRRLVDTSYVQFERVAATPPATFNAIGARPILSDGTAGPNVFNINMNIIEGGSFKALETVRDTDLSNLMAQIDEFAQTVIDETNLIASQGSAVPPQRTLSSGNGHKTTGGVGADLLAAQPAGWGLTPGSTFDISLVDASTGSAISTTLAAGGGTTSIVIPGAGPFTLTDLANLINANPDVGADVTASVGLDASGNPQLQMQANNAAHGVVLANNTGNAIGELGMNNFFTGTDAITMDIRADIKADPALVATARMRTSDGGLSFLDNQNVIALAQMVDSNFTFDAAGGLATQNENIAGYFITISSNLAVDISDKNARLDFQQTLFDDVNTRNSSISGVNMDEELSQMLIFQNSFQASSRIISVVDELYETLINMVR